jgi:hypothetical protein
MHSGGSIPGSEALRSLSKSERQKEGKKGGVIRLVYIGILLPPVGMSMFENFYRVMQSPDLDPDFVRDESEDFHIVAEVFSVAFKTSRANGSDKHDRMALQPLQMGQRGSIIIHRLSRQNIGLVE